MDQWICFLLIFFQVGFSSLARADRAVAAKADICARIPTSALCKTDGGAPAPAPPPPPPPSPQPTPAAPAPPPAPAPAPQALDKDAYCKQYLPNFRFYCGGPGVGDKRLGDFCPGYTSVCGVSSPAANPAAGPVSPAVGPAPAQAPQAPTASSPELCYQYQYLAQSSCTNPVTENANARYYCEFYRQNCLFTQTAPGVINTAVPAAADPRCGPYSQQFDVACIRQPITVATSEFCQSYITYCSNYQPSQAAQLPVAPAVAPALPPTGQLPPQLPPQLPQVPPQGANVSPDQVNQLCNQYQSQALQFCKGGEIGQIKQLCDQYRQYCIKPAGRRRRALWM